MRYEIYKAELKRPPLIRSYFEKGEPLKRLEQSTPLIEYFDKYQPKVGDTIFFTETYYSVVKTYFDVGLGTVVIWLTQLNNEISQIDADKFLVKIT